MSFDMSQFLVTFYEESFEGLDIMETELLDLDVGAADLETINTIFRAAHSIKGGSGTFGLNDVANFTHVMETLLDEMRDGKRDVTQNGVNILLESVDVLREMLSTLQAEEELDVDRVAEVKLKLDNLLAGESGESSPVSENNSISSETPVVVSNDSKPAGWQINFKPHEHMLQTGNDPVRMFRELETLGELTSKPDVSLLPEFLLMEPENSALAWELTLKGDIEKSAVEEVFDWVDDECDLTITALEAPNNEQVVESSPATAESTSNELDIDLLEKTFAMLAPQGEQLVARFYEELFNRYPKVKGLFLNTTTEKQQAKLLAALKLVVTNLRNQDVLVNALTEMGARHQKYGVQTEHYEAVTSTLLSVMQEFAGDAWTTTVEEAWRAALELVSSVMISAYMIKETKQEQQIAVADDTTAESIEKTVSATAEKAAPAKRKAKPSTEASSIRVSIDKVDELINMVGELVITQSMLSQLGEDEDFGEAQIEKLKNGLMQLERNTREMQENVMRIRMLPISFVFQRFPRLVHDLSAKLDKKIELILSGESTELDKTVMEKIGDPLVHLIRNSLDHGIEIPEKRIAAGKPETAQGASSLQVHMEHWFLQDNHSTDLLL